MEEEVQMRIFALILTVLSMAASAAYAQDAVKVDPKHYKVEFENESVRVLRITYGPGEKSVMHEHPGAVAVFMTDSEFHMTDPDGNTEPAPTGAPGVVIWTPATTHSPQNVGKAAAEVILIEIKSPAGQPSGGK
jgi:quercetin dioxygenase-like cupin family protein